MKENFYKKVLDNGMVILFEKRNLPVVSVAIAVKFGGINESIEEKGIAHFIEHMLYKGTPTRDLKKISEEIEKNGGELNGFTGEEVTAYWCKMPSRHLKIALDVLSDMIKNPLFDEVELEKEREVIFEEIKMHKDNPRLHVFDGLKDVLYEGSLGMNLAGTYETMNSINRKKIVKKFNEIYRPNNLVLAVVGDADFDEIVKFAQKSFGKEKGIIPKIDVQLKKDFKIEEREGIDQANLVFAYHSPLVNDEKNYAAQVLTTLMAGGMSSRLFQEIRAKRNLAYAVKGEADISKDFAYSFIYVGTNKENVEKIKGLILDEFKKVSNKLTEEELSQVKNQLIGNYQISMEDSQDQMVNLLVSEIHGDAFSFYDYENHITSVKLKDVKELAKSVLDNYSFFALVPKI
ncbi:MAG TPA: pitrilysin family protein [Candidatus Nanoarchaeia archaeon]|nr:pitrilysin family protein [Candidatus Nanoarchaeia archaeon]